MSLLGTLYNWIVKHGELSQKRNIQSLFSSKNDNVYTKKVVLGDMGLRISGCLVKSVSLTSNNGKFDDVTPRDVRVNFTNMFDKWVNIHAHLLSEKTLKQIYMTIERKYSKVLDNYK